MLRYLPFLALFALCGAAFGQDHDHHNTVTHAVKHAAHWVNHHVSAPHRRRHHRHHPSTHHKVMTAEHKVHHAAMHAEHWVKNHVSAPHKQP